MVLLSARDPQDHESLGLAAVWMGSLKTRNLVTEAPEKRGSFSIDMPHASKETLKSGKSTKGSEEMSARRVQNPTPNTYRA